MSRLRKVILSTFIVGLMICGMSEKVFALQIEGRNNLIIEPQSTQVCSVHGYAHKRDDSQGTWFAFYKGGTVYPASEYYCQCGAHVDVAHVNGTSYYWYSGTKVYTDKYQIGGFYIVPSPYYTGNPAPGWDY